MERRGSPLLLFEHEIFYILIDIDGLRLFVVANTIENSPFFDTEMLDDDVPLYLATTKDLYRFAFGFAKQYPTHQKALSLYLPLHSPFLSDRDHHIANNIPFDLPIYVEIGVKLQLSDHFGVCGDDGGLFCDRIFFTPSTKDSHGILLSL